MNTTLSIFCAASFDFGVVRALTTIILKIRTGDELTEVFEVEEEREKVLGDWRFILFVGAMACFSVVKGGPGFRNFSMDHPDPRCFRTQRPFCLCSQILLWAKTGRPWLMNRNRLRRSTHQGERGSRFAAMSAVRKNPADLPTCSGVSGGSRL